MDCGGIVLVLDTQSVCEEFRALFFLPVYFRTVHRALFPSLLEPHCCRNERTMIMTALCSPAVILCLPVKPLTVATCKQNAAILQRAGQGQTRAT